MLKAFKANQGLLLAGAVAYYALLSVVPLLILVVMGLSHFVNQAELLETLGRYLEWVVPGQSRAAAIAWAALLFLWLPGAIFAAQVRPYALLFLAATAQTIAFARLIDQPTLRRAFAWTACASLTILTHYMGATLGLAQGLLLVAALRRPITPSASIVRERITRGCCASRGTRRPGCPTCSGQPGCWWVSALWLTRSSKRPTTAGVLRKSCRRSRSLWSREMCFSRSLGIRTLRLT